MYDDCSLLLTGTDFNCMSLTEFWGLKLMCSMPITCIFHDGYRVFSGEKKIQICFMYKMYLGRHAKKKNKKLKDWFLL